jgi:hypothetical protein
MDYPLYDQIGAGYDLTRKADPEITRRLIMRAIWAIIYLSLRKNRVFFIPFPSMPKNRFREQPDRPSRGSVFFGCGGRL